MKKGSIPRRGAFTVQSDSGKSYHVDKNKSPSQDATPAQCAALSRVQTRAQTRSQVHTEAGSQAQEQLRSATQTQEAQHAQHAQQASDSDSSAHVQHHRQISIDSLQHAAGSCVSPEGLQSSADGLTQAKSLCCHASKPVSPLQQPGSKRKHTQRAVINVDTDQSAIGQSGTNTAHADPSSAVVGQVKGSVHNKKPKAAKVQITRQQAECKSNSHRRATSRRKK